jgi:hypothetical protein
MPASPVAAAPVKSGGSVVKFVLIAVAVLFLFGIASLASMYFMGRRLLHTVESVTGEGSVANTLRAAANAGSNHVADAKRDGCVLLSKEEAASILQVDIEKVSGAPTAQESGEHCDYFIKVGTPEEEAERVKQALAVVQAKQGASGDTKEPGNPSESGRKTGVTDLMKNINRGMVATLGDGSSAPYMNFTIERENGGIQYNAFKIANALGTGDVAPTEALAGLGDKAYLGPMDSMLCVLKGNTALTIMLGQVPDGKTKGIELARKIVARL